MVSPAAYCSLLALTGTVLVLQWRRRSNASSGEPPLVPHWIPWVGSAISMGKDADAFFNEAVARFGPVFKVKSFGTERVFITSLPIINQIYREAETFMFLPFRLESAISLFRLSREAAYSTAMVAAMEVHHRRLSPKATPELLRPYVSIAVSEFSALRSQFSNSERGKVPMKLKDLLLPTAFSAGTRTFLGRDFPAERIFADFQTYDRQLPLFVVGAPYLVISEGLKAWDRVMAVVAEHLKKGDPSMSTLVREYDEVFEDSRWTLEDRASVVGSNLWAINANAIWTVYWLITMQLQQPEGLAPLVREIDASREAYVSAHPDKAGSLMSDPEALFDWLQGSGASMPLVASTIFEVLRHVSSTASARIVTRDTNLAGYALRKGAHLVCLTRSVHTNDEVHQNADAFVPTRFMSDGALNMEGGKGGLPMNMMPFGGGVSMCEGRYFVLGEIRTYMVLLLTMFTIEGDPQSHARPKLNTARVGFGILHADGDMDVSVSPRVF